MIEGPVGSQCKTLEGCHLTLWGSIAELSATLQHHHELVDGILKSLLKLKPSAGKNRNVSFSPSSGVTEPMSMDGGLSADDFFDQGGFTSNGQADNVQEPTI